MLRRPMRLPRDVEANERKSLSFGSILAMMAALLFGAAILIFVAANWEAIPRLARVAALFAVILGGYVGGAVLKTRDHAGHRRGAVDRGGSGVRRLDRADRPDVSPVRRRGFRARHLGRRHGAGGGRAAFEPADRRRGRHRRCVAVPEGVRLLRRTPRFRIPSSLMAVVLFADFVLDPQPGGAAPDHPVVDLLSRCMLAMQS